MPRTIVKSREDILQATSAASVKDDAIAPEDALPWDEILAGDHSPRDTIDMLNEAMQGAAKALDFEKAAALRDRIEELKAQWGIGK